MPKRPLYYTFGNHMHWVDMQWLWGYGTLPGSTRDMLELCRRAKVRGNVNFDAVGYERMAAECPEALASLREAVARGVVEPVGSSYGQPYALFQGGESNVRQFTFGVRATRRTLGVRPRTFWEEEFYVFPQLVQVLRGCGFDAACLFFQWTWHTPEIPKEAESLIEWEGIDGSRVPALPRNGLNVHQWPEDFDGLLEQNLVRELDGPAIVQWLELMPSRDWMCRSEVLLPRLLELMRDRRFELRPRTAGKLVRELAARWRRGKRPLPARRYGPDDVWHGMTLGKNADAHPRASFQSESSIVAAESLSTVTSARGRPYASWDLYPTGELDEAWRETLAAQHHDNHECEGLCGFVGHASFERGRRLAREVSGRAMSLLALRGGVGDARRVRVNVHGWSVGDGAAAVPPFGYVLDASPARTRSAVTARRASGKIVLSRGALSVAISTRTGTIVAMAIEGCAITGANAEIGGLRMRRGGSAVDFRRPKVQLDAAHGRIDVTHELDDGAIVRVTYALSDSTDAVDIDVRLGSDARGGTIGARPDAGLEAALQIAFDLGIRDLRIHADAPYSVSEVRGSGSCRRKYPSGDWMTSPQWFEEVRDPFTAWSLVDLDDGSGAGALIAHDGSQQWFRDGDRVRAVITAYDPWDEARYSAPAAQPCRFRVTPHRVAMSNAARVRAACEFRRTLSFDPRATPVGGGTGAGKGAGAKLPAIPRRFGIVDVVGAPGVLAHALYRDSTAMGDHLPAWAGHAMAQRSNGACTHPVALRLVEWNGEPANVTVKVLGPVGSAAKTNLMGEVGADVGGGADTSWLDVASSVAPAWGRNIRVAGKRVAWSEVRFAMRPREIATIMFDMTIARKEWRDLDERRAVWATVHRAKPKSKRAATEGRGAKRRARTS